MFQMKVVCHCTILFLCYGSIMAQAARHWLLTAETWVQSQVTSSAIRGERSGSGSIIPPLHHTHLSLPHVLCDCPWPSSTLSLYLHTSSSFSGFFLLFSPSPSLVYLLLLSLTLTFSSTPSTEHSACCHLIANSITGCPDQGFSWVFPVRADDSCDNGTPN